jgi:signal transduction histidine kinase
LLTSLLESAGTRLPRLERHDLRRIVHASVAMLSAQAEQKRIGIVEMLGEEPLWAECDDEQIKQVLLNLLINALQILRSGDRIEVSGGAESGMVHIEVGDSGPGIREGDQAKIFEPFVSMRSGGIGLGLAVVKHIVAAHHGEITISDSRLGGALFTIRLRNGEQA